VRVVVLRPADTAAKRDYFDFSTANSAIGAGCKKNVSERIAKEPRQ
jgi:hypothetical protein